jgi:hypothetical protein
MKVRSLLHEARENKIPLDVTTLEYTMRRTLERVAENAVADPGDLSILQQLDDHLRVARSLPFPVILWSVQNKIYEIYQRSYKRIANKAAKQDQGAAAWISTFRSLAHLADVKVD